MAIYSAPRRPGPVGQCRGHVFTLLELVVVLVVMAIITGIGVTAVGALGKGDAINGAARMLDSQLRLTRQEAIIQRQLVALLLPDNDDGPDDIREYRASAMRTALVTSAGGGSYDFVSYTENSKWLFTPEGVYLNHTTVATSVQTCDGVPFDEGGGITVNGLRCIVFKPTGALDFLTTNDVTIEVGKGELSGTTLALDVVGKITLNVQWLTGKLKYL